MKLLNPNLFLEQIIMQLEEGRVYSSMPLHDEKSCISVALENKEFEAADYMISKMPQNIEPDLINKEKWLFYSANSNYPELDEKIITLGADVRLRDETTNLEPIIYAILENSPTKIKQILDSNNTFRKEDLNTYFHLACQRGAFNCLENLLENGADMESIGVTGNTPLLSSIFNDQEMTSHRLIDLGANANKANSQGMTPLIAATAKGMESTVAELIEHKADVNHMPYLGYTPLMLASRYGYNNIATNLLKHNADTEIINHDEQTAMDMAIKYENNETAQILQIAGAKCKNLSFIVKSNIDSIREKVFGNKKTSPEHS